MKTNFLTSLVIVVLIFIFIIWSLNLNKIIKDEDIKEGLLYILKQAGEEIKQSIKVFKKEVNEEIDQNIINNAANKIDDGNELIKDKKIIHRLEKTTK